MISIQPILQFNPADQNYTIPDISTQLNHLFVFATTINRTISNVEKVQHIISTYNKIKWPESWAQWVQSTAETIEDGTLSYPQK